MKIDPIEKYPKMRAILAAAENEAEAQLLNHPLRGQIGYCHECWETKKRILKEKYGIEWKTPSEMNPDILFD